VATNDVLSLGRPTRCHCWLIMFLGPGTPATQFRWLYLHSLCGATLCGSNQLHLLPSVWRSLVRLHLPTSVGGAWQPSRTQMVDKNSGPILAVCAPKFMKYWHNVGTLRAFQCPSPLVYGIFRSKDIRHYVSKSLKNRTNVKNFGPQFSGEGRPRLFYGSLLARFTVHRLAKFGWPLSSVCWSACAKPGNEIECTIYAG